MRDRHPYDYKMSCLTDYEPRHGEFVRDSRIPYGYFDRERLLAWRVSEVVLSVLCVAALAAFFFFPGTP